MLMILSADKKMQKIVDNPSSISKYSPQKFEKVASQSSCISRTSYNHKGFRAYVFSGNKSIRYSMNGTRFDATHFYGDPYWVISTAKGGTTKYPLF